MQDPRPLALLLPLLVLAACGEDQSPTAPTPPAEPSGPAFSHTAGHKVVNSLADPGDGTCNATQCTLREAINAPGSTEISFAPGLTGPITLARSGLGGGTLVIEKTLTITGPSAGVVILRRSVDPVFLMLRIGTGVSVKLTNLTLRNGGGINNFGTLALNHCRVTGQGIGNHLTLTLTNSMVVGGGIGNRAHGTLTITNSTIAHSPGGGIFNLGTLTLTNSTVAYNSGGGIDDFRGTSTLIKARIVGNSAAFDGGGIRTFNSRVTLTNSTVAGNSARFGGGIANRDGSTFRITNSTIAGNSAAEVGGGILNSVTLRLGAHIGLTNSTVSGNSAGSGGGIVSSGGEFASSVGLLNSTVVRNTATHIGGGIVQAFSGLGLTNSLVAQNTPGPDVISEPSESVVSAFFSLIGDGTGTGLTNTNGNQVGSASAPIDPKLGPLADNGGPTRTHALLLGSPAIDAASTPDCPPTDQRGVLRPQGAACDIGSYERE